MRSCDNLLELDMCVMKKVAHKEYGRTEADMKRCLDSLKEWVKTQPHFPEMPNDALLLQFLNINKFSVEKTKPRIDMYYTVRSLIPSFFKERNPNSPLMRRQSELTYILPLPKMTPDHCRVVYLRLNENYSPEEADFDLIMAHGLNTMEVLMQEDFPIGMIIVFDCVFVKLAHVPIFNFMTMQRLKFVLEKIFSNRLKALYITNAPGFVDVVISMLKSVLPEKLANRVHVSRNFQSIFDVLPKEMFPEDLGGNEVSCKTLNDLWQKKFEEYKDRFAKLETLEVNEKLRPSALVNDDILGYYGNFKKLDVD